MIRSLIRQKAESKGIQNAYQLGLLIDVTPNVSARLWGDNFAQIGKVTLNKICVALDCNVGDILVYEAEKKARKQSR